MRNCTRKFHACICSDEWMRRLGKVRKCCCVTKPVLSRRHNPALWMDLALTRVAFSRPPQIVLNSNEPILKSTVLQLLADWRCESCPCVLFFSLFSLAMGAFFSRQHLVQPVSHLQ